MTTKTTTASRAFWAVLAGWWALFALAAWWMPLQHGDWDRLWWAEAHGLSALLGHAARTRDLGDVVGVLLAGSRLAHVLLSPLAMVALLVGVVAHVRGRLPRPDRDDAWLLVVAGAMLWIAIPGAGVAFTARPWVAGTVLPAGCLVWLFALLRFERPHPVALGALGLASGLGDPRLAVAALGVLVIAGIARRRRAPAWMWIGVAALAAGLALRLTGEPDPALAALARRAMRRNMLDMLIYLDESGEVVAFTALAALLTFLRRRFRDAAMPAPPPDAIPRVLWLTFLSPVVMVIAAISAHAAARALLAPMLLLALAGLNVLDTLRVDRWARRGLLAVAIAIHAVAALMLAIKLGRAHADFERRMAILHAAPAGSVPTIPAYRQVIESFWFAGEDFGAAAVRESVARLGLGLGGIDVQPRFGHLEPTPSYRFAMRWDMQPAPSETEIAAAVPGGVSGDLTTARHQFRLALERLASGRTVRGGTLVVENLEFPERRGRPVIAALAPGGRMVAPYARSIGPNRADRSSFVVDDPSPLIDAGERYVVQDGTAQVADRREGRYWYRRRATGHHALVLCAPSECQLVDSGYGSP